MPTVRNIFKHKDGSGKYAKIAISCSIYDLPSQCGMKAISGLRGDISIMNDSSKRNYESPNHVRTTNSEDIVRGNKSTMPIPTSVRSAMRELSDFKITNKDILIMYDELLNVILRGVTVAKLVATDTFVGNVLDSSLEEYGLEPPCLTGFMRHIGAVGGTITINPNSDRPIRVWDYDIKPHAFSNKRVSDHNKSAYNADYLRSTIEEYCRVYNIHNKQDKVSVQFNTVPKIFKKSPVKKKLSTHKSAVILEETSVDIPVRRTA